MRRRTFECEGGASCSKEASGGVCTAAGYCAFPDADCPSSLRYGADAGSLAGQCVPTDDASTSTSTTGRASTGDGDTTSTPTGSTSGSTGADATGTDTTGGSTTGPVPGFTAYNDLAWGPAQSTQNITTYTSPVGGSMLESSGPLVDYATGKPTAVLLSVSGGSFAKEGALQGAEPPPGSDADAVFAGALSATGVVSYVDDAEDSLVLTLTELDPGKTYEVVFFAHRNLHGWDRASLVTLESAAAFENASTFGLDDLGEPVFTGVSDPSTRVPSDNDAGTVVRFRAIESGGDGQIALRVTWDGTDGTQFLGKYGSALMVRESP